MYIEHPITTQRANTYGAALEAETQAIRALSDAMAMICEGLLQRGLPEAKAKRKEKIHETL